MSDFSATSDHFASVRSGGIQMTEMHYHDSYELYYLEVGNREYFVENKLFPVSSGEFVLIPPGKLHRTGGEYGKRTLVGFSKGFLLNYYTEDMVQRFLECFDRVKLLPLESQQNGFKEWLKTLAVCRDDTEFALTLGRVLLELSKCAREELRDDPISIIVTYINQNYASISSIEDIARHFYISKFHLCRTFKQSMQITVVDYMNKVRIKNACDFLEATNETVSKISALCGFNSPAYFSTVFRKMIGISPAEYRKRKEKQF